MKIPLHALMSHLMAQSGQSSPKPKKPQPGMGSLDAGAALEPQRLAAKNAYLRSLQPTPSSPLPQPRSRFGKGDLVPLAGVLLAKLLGAHDADLGNFTGGFLGARDESNQKADAYDMRQYQADEQDSAAKARAAQLGAQFNYEDVTDRQKVLRAESNAKRDDLRAAQRDQNSATNQANRLILDREKMSASNEQKAQADKRKFATGLLKYVTDPADRLKVVQWADTMTPSQIEVAMGLSEDELKAVASRALSEFKVREGETLLPGKKAIQGATVDNINSQMANRDAGTAIRRTGVSNQTRNIDSQIQQRSLKGGIGIDKSGVLGGDIKSLKSEVSKNSTVARNIRIQIATEKGKQVPNQGRIQGLESELSALQKRNSEIQKQANPYAPMSPFADGNTVSTPAGALAGMGAGSFSNAPAKTSRYPSSSKAKQTDRDYDTTPTTKPKIQVKGYKAKNGYTVKPRK